MYESLITQVVSQASSDMIKNQENQLMVEIRQMIGWDIDKEELIKALKYDRNQYDKGFSDGKEEGKKEVLDKLREILVNYSYSKTIEGEDYFMGKTKMRFINLEYLKELFGYECSECPFYGCPDCVSVCEKCDKE